MRPPAGVFAFDRCVIMRHVTPLDESANSSECVVVGDAFGAALKECLEAGGLLGLVPEIVERDDGLIQTGDAFRYFAPYTAWHETDRWACDSLAGRVLDVGAGATRCTCRTADAT